MTPLCFITSAVFPALLPCAFVQAESDEDQTESIAIKSTNSGVEDGCLSLAGLYERSYDLIGIYEEWPVSVSVAYNWRDKYITSLSSGTPVYMDAYGWLDESIRYGVTSKVSLMLEGRNLQETERQTYFERKTRPQTIWKNDIQVSAMVVVGF